MALTNKGESWILAQAEGDYIKEIFLKERRKNITPATAKDTSDSMAMANERYEMMKEKGIDAIRKEKTERI